MHPFKELYEGGCCMSVHSMHWPGYGVVARGTTNMSIQQAPQNVVGPDVEQLTPEAEQLMEAVKALVNKCTKV